MFKFLDNVASGFGNLFSVDSGYSPDTPMSSPDAIKTGGALSDLGFFSNNGQGEFDLNNSVKAFQETNGLKVDGVINPGGPTENAISNALTQKSMSAIDPLESTTNDLPSNVTVSKPESSKADQQSWTASASFGEPTKPKKPKLPKIDPMTGLTDPLASTPKGKMPTAKQWEEAAKIQKQKATTAIVPEGDTVQQRIQSIMADKRYNDKSDTRLRDHIVKQFKKAYPGEVQYDETGKMVQAQAAIQPEEVEPFDPDGELIGGSGKNILQEDEQTEIAQASTVETNSAEEQEPLSFKGPINKSTIREDDPYGSGHYGAPRGRRTHNGIDIKASPGQPVTSPVSGTFVRRANPYKDDSNYSGVFIKTDDGREVKIF